MLKFYSERWNCKLIHSRCVVVYHVTIVAMDIGWRNFGLFGNRLRSTHCREFLYVKLCRPAYFVRITHWHGQQQFSCLRILKSTYPHLLWRRTPLVVPAVNSHWSHCLTFPFLVFSFLVRGLALRFLGFSPAAAAVSVKSGSSGLSIPKP